MAWIKTSRGDLVNEKHISAIWRKGEACACYVVAQVNEKEYILYEDSSANNSENHQECQKLIDKIGRELGTIDIRLDKNKKLD